MRTYRILFILFLLVGSFGLIAAAPNTVAAAPMSQTTSEIDWTSDPICAPGFRPGNPDCAYSEITWDQFTAPVAGTMSVSVCALHYNTDDGREDLNYSTSWGESGSLHATEAANDCDNYTVHLEVGENPSVHFSSGATRGGSVKAGVNGSFERDPIAPTCDSWTVTPASGVAPLDVIGVGSYTDPDGIVTGVEIDWGDNPFIQVGLAGVINQPYTYQEPGEYASTLTLTWDGGVAACDSANIVVEAPSPSEPAGGSNASCEAWNAWVQADPDYTASFEVEVKVDGQEVYSSSGQLAAGERRQFDGTLSLEGASVVSIHYNVVSYDGVVVDETDSYDLDCGLPPIPMPGMCTSAWASSPLEIGGGGTTTDIHATVVDALTVELWVNGQLAQTQSFDSAFTGQVGFADVFVKPEYSVNIVVIGEDGQSNTVDKCGVTFTHRGPVCPDSYVTLYLFEDRDGDSYWDVENNIPYPGKLDWNPRGEEPGIENMHVQVKYNGTAFVTGTGQPNGWALNQKFSEEDGRTFDTEDIKILRYPAGEDGEAIPVAITSVRRLATDGTYRQLGVEHFETNEEHSALYYFQHEGGRCGAIVLLIGVQGVQPLTEETAEATSLPTVEMAPVTETTEPVFEDTVEEVIETVEAVDGIVDIDVKAEVVEQLTDVSGRFVLSEYVVQDGDVFWTILQEQGLGQYDIEWVAGLSGLTINADGGLNINPGDILLLPQLDADGLPVVPGIPAVPAVPGN